MTTNNLSRRLTVLPFTLAVASALRAYDRISLTTAIIAALIASADVAYTLLRHARSRQDVPATPPTTLRHKWSASGAARLFTFAIILWTTGELTWYVTGSYFGPPPQFVTTWTSAVWIVLTTGLIAFACAAFVYSAAALLGCELAFMPRLLRTPAPDQTNEEELFRQANDIFHDARHGGRFSGKW
jgi:hypothetical protein